MNYLLALAQAVPAGNSTITNPAINSLVGTGEGNLILQLFGRKFISIGIAIAGVLAFFMLLIGGVQWITAGGDKEAVEKARKRITQALIGLAIVFSIFAIIYLVEAIFGIPILTFQFPIIEWPHKEVSILNKKLTKIIKSSSALLTVLAAAPASILAQRDIDLKAIDPQFSNVSNITTQKVLVFAINGLLIAAALIAFFFLLIGGVQWILAGGDKEGTEKARKKITNALVGLDIVFSAYAIAFLVEAIFGISILHFTIPTIV